MDFQNSNSCRYPYSHDVPFCRRNAGNFSWKVFLLDDELSRFDFELPRELIAQEPIKQRADARMMVLDRKLQSIDHRYVRDLPTILEPGDCLVMNDSKVIPARLLGKRTLTGGRWEGLYLQSENGVAQLLCKTRGHVQAGESITLRDNDGRENQKLVVVANPSEGKMLLRPEPAADWKELLQQCGRVPLPPYIRDGQMVDSDRVRYQTVYAQKPGSIAAPTAGLHFTVDLLQQLRTAGMAHTTVTLHVGVGTFRPIQTAKLEDHIMHSEFAEISEPSARRIQTTRAEGGRVIAIGTTTVRVLESAAQKNHGTVCAWSGETDLFIRPGFQFQWVDGLLTNFHLPRSSLLVLVSTFAGYDLTMRAYDEAMREGYRFYSYGDCMLVL